MEKMGSFLSQLFEMEMDSLGVSLTLTGDDGVVFQLEESLEPVTTSNTVIGLSFDSVDDLHAIMQKVRFLEYRLEIGQMKMTEITSDGEINYFELLDFDNRVWRLSAI